MSERAAEAARAKIIGESKIIQNYHSEERRRRKNLSPGWVKIAARRRSYIDWLVIMP